MGATAGALKDKHSAIETSPSPKPGMTGIMFSFHSDIPAAFI
jgi:hypothetical protein